MPDTRKEKLAPTVKVPMKMATLRSRSRSGTASLSARRPGM